MSTRAQRAQTALERLGLAPDADDHTVGHALAGPAGVAVAEALGEIGDERIAALLAAAVPTAAAQPLRKALRRALHRLRQRGVPVTEIAAPPPTRRPLGGDEPEGLMSAVDGTGSRIVWLIRAQPSGSQLLVAAEVNVPGGLRDLSVSETSRKHLREARQRLRREARLQVVSTPFAVLDALLLEGQDRLATAERRLDYRRLRPRLTTRTATAPAEPVSTRVSPPDETEVETLLAESAALLEEPELGTWWPSPDRAAAVLERIEALDASPLVLSDVQQQQRLADLLAEGHEGLYPSEPTARWLDATAYVFAETERLEAARRALAVAQILRRTPQRAATVPLFATLVNQGIGRLLARQRGSQGEERRDALVMTPAEVLRARSSSRRGHTPG
jgi:hypothetical protein